MKQPLVFNFDYTADAVSRGQWLQFSEHNERLYHFLNYWHDHRNNDGYLDNAAVNPRALMPCLGDIFKAGATTYGDWQFSLFGTRLSNNYGRDLSGESLSIAGFGDFEPVLRTLYSEVSSRAAPVTFAHNMWFQARPYISVEAALVPLRLRDGQQGILGCVTMSEPVATFD